MAKIIGRKTEQQQLKRLLEAKEAEFLVVYGRRRVGKTFLIRNYFKDQFTFYHTALSPLELEETDLLQAQLQNFTSSLRRYGCQVDKAPKDWLSAFDILINLLQEKKEKIVIFLDEMVGRQDKTTSYSSPVAQQRHGLLTNCLPTRGGYTTVSQEKCTWRHSH